MVIFLLFCFFSEFISNINIYVKEEKNKFIEENKAEYFAEAFLFSSFFLSVFTLFFTVFTFYKILFLIIFSWFLVKNNLTYFIKLIFLKIIALTIGTDFINWEEPTEEQKKDGYYLGATSFLEKKYEKNNWGKEIKSNFLKKIIKHCIYIKYLSQLFFFNFYKLFIVINIGILNYIFIFNSSIFVSVFLIFYLSFNKIFINLTFSLILLSKIFFLISEHFSTYLTFKNNILIYDKELTYKNIKLTKKNINILTFWSLRALNEYINFKGSYYGDLFIEDYFLSKKDYFNQDEFFSIEKNFSLKLDKKPKNFTFYYLSTTLIIPKESIVAVKNSKIICPTKSNVIGNFLKNLETHVVFKVEHKNNINLGIFSSAHPIKAECFMNQKAYCFSPHYYNPTTSATKIHGIINLKKTEISDKKPFLNLNELKAQRDPLYQKKINLMEFFEGYTLPKDVQLTSFNFYNFNEFLNTCSKKEAFLIENIAGNCVAWVCYRSNYSNTEINMVLNESNLILPYEIINEFSIEKIPKFISRCKVNYNKNLSLSKDPLLQKFEQEAFLEQANFTKKLLYSLQDFIT
jgi:hypothetical protein